MGEDNRAHTVLAKDTPAFDEGAVHCVLVPLRRLLRSAVQMILLIPNGLTSFGRERVSFVQGIAKKWMLWEHALEPDEEEVGQVRVGNRVIVRRIREPDRRGLVGQRMLGGVGGLDLPSTRAGP